MAQSLRRTWVFVALMPCACVAASAARATQTQETQVLIAEGQKALSEKHYEAAERDFSRLLQLGVHTAPVYSNLGVACLRLGKIDKAIQMLDKAKSLAPGVAGIRLNLGLAYLQEHEFKLASKSFGEVLAMEPRHVQAHYLKGLCDFMTDDFQGAVNALEPIRDQEKDDLEYLFMLGISYGMLKQKAEAQQTFARLVEGGNDTPHLHLLLGKAYLALGELDEADKELRQATIGATLPYAHYYRGILAQKQGNIDEAAEQFLKEVALVPTNPWAYKELAAIQMNRNEDAAAIELLKKGVANNPESAELAAALGRAYLKPPDPKRAIPLFQKAIAMDPKNGMYRYQLARAYLAEGRKQDADAEMARARALTTETEGEMQQFLRDQAPRPAATP